MRDLENKINVFNILYLLLFLCLTFVCISFCRYYIYGDSQFYIAGLCKLRGDYFPVNFKSFLAGTGDHISLKTEGGFSFILLLFSFINWELPFFISAFFTVGFLFILSLLSRDGKRFSLPLAGIFAILVLLLIPKFSYGIVMLSQCLRDSSAHFFGLLGFLLCSLSINGKRGMVALFFGAFCVGIACWCRVPNLLFIMPISVYLLLSLKSLWFKKFFQSMLVLMAGLIVGLLPLFGQNILEGRPFYVASQMDTLVLKIPKVEQSIFDVEEDIVVEQTHVLDLAAQNYSKKGFTAVSRGMSFKNFSYTSINLYRFIQGILGKTILFLFLLSSVIALFVNYRLSLSLLSGSLFFFLFYSCYDKVVGRYAVIIPLMLLPMVALSLAKIIDLVVRVSRQQKYELIIQKVLATLLTFVSLFLMFNYSKGIGELLQERKYCVAYRDEIKGLLTKDDVYICFNTIINSWTAYFTGAENFLWLLSAGEHWDIHADQDAQFEKFDDKIKAGKDAFYIEMQADNTPFKYWSKQDVNLHYELNVVNEVAPIFNDYGRVLVSQITERDAKERIVKCSVVSESPARLLLWAADASDDVPKIQQVILSTGDLSITNELIKGINIYDIPIGFIDKQAELMVSSSQNLPLIIDAKAFSTNTTVMFQSYENMPASLLTLPGSKPFWYGRYQWSRESRKDGKYIDPLIALPQTTSFFLFNNDKMQMTLRVLTVGTITHNVLKENLSTITLENGGDDYPLLVDIVRTSKRGDRRIIVADLSVDLSSVRSEVCEFTLSVKDADQAPIFLKSISFKY